MSNHLGEQPVCQCPQGVGELSAGRLGRGLGTHAPGPVHAQT